MRFWLLLATTAMAAVSLGGETLEAQQPVVGKYGEGTLDLHVVDQDSGQPVPCRIHLKNAAGAPQQQPGAPFWKDHFVCPGNVTLKPKRGAYSFEIEAGPEYAVCYGHFEINDFAVDEKTVEMRRIINMAQDGWWSGDLHIHRPVKDIEALMLADDLHVAPVITWTNKKSEWTKHKLPESPVVKFDGNRYYDLLAGEDDRAGGPVLFFRLSQPLDLSTRDREYPPVAKLLAQAHEQPNAWVDVPKPFAADLPVLLAAGHVDSIGIAHSHMLRSGVTGNEAQGKARDKKAYPDPWGNAEWSREIYHHVLNCGLRIPPSAGSGTGEVANPLGYDRMYVHVDPEQFNYDRWWEGFKAGRVIVSNGPLIEPVANDELPGHVFRAKTGQTLSIDVMIKNFATRDKIAYLEVIRDGRVESSVRIEEFAKTGHFPPLVFQESGWFLIRMVAEVKTNYRFAMSAPWYVEFDKTPRVSQDSVQFFLDWLEERAAAVKLADEAQQREVQATFDTARQFWQKLLSEANAE